MASSTAVPPAKSGQRQVRNSGRSWTATILIAASAVFCIMVLLFARFWPFTEARVLQDLREASDSRVRVQAFHKTYFPPGCILYGVVFDHEPGGAAPLIAIQKLTMQGSYSGLLYKHLTRITADGLRVVVPAFGTSQALHTTPSKITIGELVANGSTLQFASRDPSKQPSTFDIHEASLKDVGWNGSMAYRIRIHNPNPPGEIVASGKFGVWNKGNPGQTPVSGEYKFEQADLDAYEGIGGQLSSTGKFGGTLAHIDISGVTDTPDFVVKSGGHPMRLTTRFSAYVDATQGNTFLKQVDGDFWRTHVVAHGSVAKSSDAKGRIALVDLKVRNARIEDLLMLFVKDKRAPMSGPVSLQVHTEIPPGDEDFLKKVRLQGSFGIADGEFAQASTQEGVNKLSAGARGEKKQSDPGTALTDLSGKMDVRNGIAHFTDLSFGIPGASARLHGTYNLINYKIDLHGQLQLESKISNAESGTKAVLLKAIEPFFKKKKKGEIIPVRVSGTYSHPQFGLDLEDKKAQKVAPPNAPRQPRKPGP